MRECSQCAPGALSRSEHSRSQTLHPDSKKACRRDNVIAIGTESGFDRARISSEGRPRIWAHLHYRSNDGRVPFGTAPAGLSRHHDS
jgi:hypothetical protein